MAVNHLHHLSTPHDPFLPDFIPDAAHADAVNVRDGDWSDPGTWRGGLVPTEDAKVFLSGGSRVTVDTPGARARSISVKGEGTTLRFAADRTTGLYLKYGGFGALQVSGGGLLEIGTEGSPIQPGVECNIVSGDTPIDTTQDPGQYGNGILVVDGEISLFGDRRRPGWTWLAKEAHRHDTSIELRDPPVNWKRGDWLYLDDSHPLRVASDGQVKEHYFGAGGVWQGEYAQVERVDGARVHLQAPLEHDHLGVRDGNAGMALPHVANLSSNVWIYSENTDNQQTRGHVLVTGHSDVDVVGVSLYGLGRTTDGFLDDTVFRPDGTAEKVGANQRGRYAWHYHHVRNKERYDAKGFTARFKGNSVWIAGRWSAAIHGTQATSFKDNNLVGAQGSGLVLEDPTAAFNRVEGNLISAVFAHRMPGQRAHADDTDFAYSGEGIWAHAMNNDFVGNVLSNCGWSGYNFFLFDHRGFTVPLRPYAGPDEMLHTTPDSVPWLGLVEGGEIWACGKFALETWNFAFPEDVWNFRGVKIYNCPKAEDSTYTLRLRCENVVVLHSGDPTDEDNWNTYGFGNPGKVQGDLATGLGGLTLERCRLENLRVGVAHSRATNVAVRFSLLRCHTNLDVSAPHGSGVEGTRDFAGTQLYNLDGSPGAAPA